MLIGASASFAITAGAAARRNREALARQIAITTQPGAPVQPAPGAEWMPQPLVTYGTPPGLEYLFNQEMIMIHQIQEALPFFFSYQLQNKYVMKNADGEQCYYAFEESDSCDRCCNGPGRTFVMHIVDHFQKNVFTFTRDFLTSCDCCVFRCCCNGELYHQSLTVSTPATGVLGVVKQQIPGFCRKKRDYHIFDQTGELIFEIDGSDEWSCGGFLVDMEFSIRITKTDTVVGMITNKSTTYPRQELVRPGAFFVSFPENLNVKLKGLILGAGFFIDFVHFQYQGGGGAA